MLHSIKTDTPQPAASAASPMLVPPPPAVAPAVAPAPAVTLPVAATTPVVTAESASTVSRKCNVGTFLKKHWGKIIAAMIIVAVTTYVVIRFKILKKKQQTKQIKQQEQENIEWEGYFDEVEQKDSTSEQVAEEARAFIQAKPAPEKAQKAQKPASPQDSAQRVERSLRLSQPQMQSFAINRASGDPPKKKGPRRMTMPEPDLKPTQDASQDSAAASAPQEPPAQPSQPPEPQTSAEGPPEPPASTASAAEEAPHTQG